MRTAACDFYQFCSAGDRFYAVGDQLPINRTIFSKETVSKVNFTEKKDGKIEQNEEFFEKEEKRG